MPGMAASMKLTCVFGSRAERCRRARKQLRLREHLRMDFHADDDFPIAVCAPISFEALPHARSCRPPPCVGFACESLPPRSMARPTRSTVASSNALPMTCSPSGSPSVVSPAGTEMRRQPGQIYGYGENIVQIHRNGIGDLFADRERGPGVDGVSITSHCSKACAKSRAISVRTFCART